ncbi:PfkB family carbohydrate kinase [Testudinibacter sp. TR-2022]|uniref:PfkB family carbohydrate kinase n=1 Tax=Testudinibacter sp. TR-2022 TaxID=2585029 RepID=UPI00111B5ADE|nr:PfkB family carbohydrate kinase [Testudinibacter sp. TR-2022]TNH08551.1 winged helix-turn-helix transcriptional regulator [Pasteurellaceae bacterium Phil11]TNH22098.1 winged helix-turn-helix transcriptional regulator [Testudinibacter sp. TR-2022]TNH26586.1 winged helix-turn-helix transcriptional regulator [Testudinibacter sp. TR-2022]
MNREQQILELLRKDPLMPQQQIADNLGLSRSSVAGYIMNLMHKGQIRGKGYILSPQQRVVTIGGTNMDIAGYSLGNIVFGDSNLGKIKCTPGGVGRNIAQNIAMLGKESHLISVVGDDLYGETVLERTKQAGAYVDRCYQLHNETTSTYLSLLDDNGEMVVAINDMDILKNLTPALLSSRLTFIQHADAIVLDCNLTEKTLAWIFSNSADIPIFVDSVSTFKAMKIKNWLSHIHTLKPNRLEAEALSGIEIKTNDDVLNVATWFHQQGLKRLVLSLGSRGVYFSEKDGMAGWAEPLKVNIVNVTGAGDAMMAGLVCCWLENITFADSVRYAQACAAMALSSEFTNNPNLSDDSVKKLLEVQL